jgi:hypothetical protein
MSKQKTPCLAYHAYDNQSIYIYRREDKKEDIKYGSKSKGCHQTVKQYFNNLGRISKGVRIDK